MAMYSDVFTFPSSGSADYTMDLEGDVITHLWVRLPPGPQGLLHIAIFYGIVQIFPKEEGTYFAGDNEVIDWEEEWELPETPSQLHIIGINLDEKYDHSAYIKVATAWNKDRLAARIADEMIKRFRGLMGMV